MEHIVVMPSFGPDTRGARTERYEKMPYSRR